MTNKFQAVMVYDAPTVVRGRNIPLIKAGKHVTIPGGLFPRHRKQIVITNEDTTPLYIVNGRDGSADLDTTTEKLMRLGLGESVTLFTNADITIKNLSASDTLTDVQILEVVYA